MYRTPYDVYERVVGEYHPDNPPDPPFSVWMSEQKRDFLAEHPEEKDNQIDGCFYQVALDRFFRWISDRYQGGQ